MTRRTVFRFGWVLTILVVFSLGCQLVNRVGEAVSEGIQLATDIGGLATDIDLEGLTTEIGGIATEIDLESLTTEIGGIATEIDIESVVTEMGGIMTDIPFFDEGTPAPVFTPVGFPSDIPLMTGALSEMSGDANRIEYNVDTDLNAVVDFYRREMAARGWAEQSSTTGDGEATLVFVRDNRRAEVKIIEDFFFGLTVTITLG